MAEGRIEELRKRIERDPGSRLFAQLAEELRKEGELEEAIRVARAGLEKHPAYPSARLTLGRALLDSGDPAAARSELEAAVAGAPDNILASRLLGEALETLGDLGAALLQYETTLQLAPNDGHVEARVRAIQERLGAPSGSGRAAGGASGSKSPMATPDGSGASEAGDLPPTIRIRMPGDSAMSARAPLPPVPTRTVGTGPESGAANLEETTLPVTRSVLKDAEPGGPAGEGGPGAELPATLPMPGADDEGGASEVPGETDAAPAGESAAAAPPRLTEPEPVFAEDTPAPTESDLAPTLPRSRAAEYAALDEPLPPTLPPGVITSVEEVEDAGPAATDEGVGGLPGAPVDEPLEVPAEALLEEASEALAPESASESAIGGAEQVGERAAGAAEEQEAAGGGERPLSSATLAELYFQQGLLERAVEVYRQVLEEEPANATAQARLREIEAAVAASAAELPVPAPEAEDDRAARRHALERAIARLEALLALVRRDRP